MVFLRTSYYKSLDLYFYHGIYRSISSIKTVSVSSRKQTHFWLSANSSSEWKFEFRACNRSCAFSCFKISCFLSSIATRSERHDSFIYSSIKINPGWLIVNPWCFIRSACFKAGRQPNQKTIISDHETLGASRLPNHAFWTPSSQFHHEAWWKAGQRVFWSWQPWQLALNASLPIFDNRLSARHHSEQQRAWLVRADVLKPCSRLVRREANRTRPALDRSKGSKPV